VRESDNLPPSGAEVTKESYTSTRPYIFMVGRGIIDFISDNFYSSLKKDIALFYFIRNGGRDSVVGVEFGLRAGRSGFRTLAGQDVSFSPYPFRPALRPNHSPLEWVIEALHGGMAAGPWCGPSVPSSAEVKYEWSYTSTPISVPVTEIYGDTFTFMMFSKLLTSSKTVVANMRPPREVFAALCHLNIFSNTI